jgi:hypothetical protein
MPKKKPIIKSKDSLSREFKKSKSGILALFSRKGDLWTIKRLKEGC